VKSELGKQTLEKLVLLEPNCMLPLELTRAVVNVMSYSVMGNGAVMTTVQSSQWLPVSSVPGTIVAPVEGLIWYWKQGFGVLVTVGVLVAVRVFVAVGGVPVTVLVGVRVFVTVLVLVGVKVGAGVSVAQSEVVIRRPQPYSTPLPPVRSSVMRRDHVPDDG
jgi:hypothetical protein